MLGTSGLPSGSTQRASSWARQSERPLRLSRDGLLSRSASQAPQVRHRASSRARHRRPPPRLVTEGFLSGSVQRFSDRARQRGTLSGSGERASPRARKRGLLPRFNTEAILKLDTKGIR